MRIDLGLGRRDRARKPIVGLVASLLAATVATGVVGPSRVGEPRVDHRERSLATQAGPGWARTTTFELDSELVGFTWDDPTAAELRLRGRRADGSWTEWIELEGAPSESPETGEAGPAQGSAGPAWLGRDMRSVQVVVRSGSLSNFALHEIDSDPPQGAGLGPASASALPYDPGIITRAAWGADESWRTVNDGCGRPTIASNATYSILHHTAGTNDYTRADSAALIRGIYYFHVFGRGWCDIAYNFLVDKYGQTFEGRYGGIYDAVVGGHTGGFNTGSIGVSVLGDLTSVPLSDAAYQSLVSLLAFKLGHHGIYPMGTTTVRTVDHPSSRYPGGQSIQVQTVVPHGDLSQTSCPGRIRERIASLRSAVTTRIAAQDRDPRLMADWDGNGTDTPAVYQNGHFYIRNQNSRGPIQVDIPYGTPTYVPVAGDWDGNGTDTIGVYVNGTWYLRNSNTPGYPDITVSYGYAGARPVVGDWDGDGKDGIGVFDGGRWYLRQTTSPGAPHLAFSYGEAGYQPTVGDWDADGADGIGVFTGGYHHLRDTPTAGWPTNSVWYGDGRDKAVAGDWNDDRRDTIGVNRGAYWYLLNRNAPGTADLVFWF